MYLVLITIIAICLTLLIAFLLRKRQFWPYKTDTQKIKILKAIRLICIVPYVWALLFVIFQIIIYSPNPGGWDFGPLGGLLVLVILIFDGGGYLPMWPLVIVTAIGIVTTTILLSKTKDDK